MSLQGGTGSQGCFSGVTAGPRGKRGREEQQRDGCRQVKGSPAVPVTQEEAKVRSARKEEEEEKDFRGEGKQKNTLTRLSCSLGH